MREYSGQCLLSQHLVFIHDHTEHRSTHVARGELTPRGEWEV